MINTTLQTKYEKAYYLLSDLYPQTNHQYFIKSLKPFR
ncbi:hypothetical protein RINTHM_14870 [Richelia intracellularis HM01]|nr:hypothetical protein RINTHM_14870 [Richelia intracellularis HM01]